MNDEEPSESYKVWNIIFLSLLSLKLLSFNTWVHIWGLVGPKILFFASPVKQVQFFTLSFVTAKYQIRIFW